MSRVLLISSAVVLALGGCAGTRGGPDGQPGRIDRPSDSKAVYLAVLEQMWSDDRTQRLVIDPMALRDEVPTDYHRRSLESLSAGTLRDFRRQNRGARALPPDLETRLPVTWLDGQWARRYSKEAAAEGRTDLEAVWDLFHERHPGSSGYITFSPIGFSPDGRQALVGTSSSSASLSGGGYLVLLEFRGRWVVADKVMTWIS